MREPKFILVEGRFVQTGDHDDVTTDSLNPTMKREQELFEAALVMRGTARRAFLQQQCKSDPRLFLRVKALLREHEECDDFLCESAAEAIGDINFGETQLYGESIGPYRVLEPIGEGEFLVTDWVEGGLLAVDRFGVSRVLTDLESGSADLGFIPALEQVVVPMTAHGSIVAYQLK